MGQGRTQRALLAAAATVVASFFLQPAAASALVFTVNSTADTAGMCPTLTTCTLRQAINSANSASGADAIQFDFFSPTTISPTTQLPAITEQTSIVGSGPVVLDGAGAGADVDGLQLSSGADHSVIDGLAIDRFSRDGVLINGASSASVRSSVIGTDYSSSAGLGNGRNGITLVGSTGVQVGVGPFAPQDNVIVGNAGDGINADATSASTTITSNDIGFSPVDQAGMPNGGDGIDLSGPSNVVGTAALGNTIVANSGVGVRIDGVAANGNQIRGNSIGIDPSGSADGNDAGGLSITAGSGNVVGGNGGAGNTISGNGGDGLDLSSGATGNHVIGNRIGTDGAGSAPRANDGAGVRVTDSPANVLGGPSPGMGNVVSSNLFDGVRLENSGSHDNVVQGNRIGTNGAGTLALPNDGDGVSADGDNLIGGSGAGDGNLVSGNLSDGIRVTGGSRVQGNFAGTNATGTGAIPNGSAGIGVDGLIATVGGADGAANTVAFNLGPGIGVDGVAVIAENSTFSNVGLGIDLHNDGVTPNDPGDANGLQNFPDLSQALATGGQTVVRGSITGAANVALPLLFFSSPECDASGFGEGKTPIGTAEVVTDHSGHGSFAVTLPTATQPGQQVTAIANGSAGASEFSACRIVEPAPVTPPPTQPPPIKRAPQLTSVIQSASIWRVGSGLAKLTKARPPVGTTFGFTLNESASVRFDFTQRVAGRRVGRRCVAQTRANRRKPKCTRTISAGTLTIAGHAGKNRVRFEGRLSRTKRLKPGRYTVTITATASGLRSAPRSLNFTLVKS